MLRNLDRYAKQLNIVGDKLLVQAGYLHHEGHNVVAIDQKGGGGNLQETRLYTYAVKEQNVLHLITIGNKETQASDVALCKEFVESLRSPREEK